MHSFASACNVIGFYFLASNVSIAVLFSIYVADHNSKLNYFIDSIREKMIFSR